MAGIPDAVIEEVRAASDLVDVVSDRVRLKKQGSSYVGLCPFHNEKSPSFNVVPDKGFFHCFGCGSLATCSRSSRRSRARGSWTPSGCWPTGPG